MLYSSFGAKLTIEYQCIPAYPPKGLPHNLHLLKCVHDYDDGNPEYHYDFAENLRADDGINEIMLSVESAPILKLNREQTKQAYLDAE